MTFAKQSNTAGGLAKLYILRLSHFQGIKYIPSYSTYAMNDISAYLEEIYLTQDTISYTVKRKSGGYDTAISGTFPGSSDDLEELEGTPFLLVGLSYNNEYMLFGDANNYFIYDYDQDGGSNFEDLAQTKFDLTRSMMFKPRVIFNPLSGFAPVISSIAISGDAIEANTVEGSYTYFDLLSLAESGTTYKWYVTDDTSGTNKIEVGTELSYTIGSDYVGKYLQFDVTPKNSAGITGSTYLSSYYLIEDSTTVYENNFYFGGQYFDVSSVDESIDHYLFQSIDHGSTAGSWDLLAAGAALDTFEALEKLYFEFDYKVNGDTFYPVRVWPAEFYDPGSASVASVSNIETSSEEVNTWVTVSGYVSSTESFNAYNIQIEYMDSVIPTDVTLEIKNFKCYKE